MAWKKAPLEMVEKFHDSMEGFEGIERRKMFGYPCCFVNGNMFTGLYEESWVLRLKEEDREAIQKLGAEPFFTMGRHMREYVFIPRAILNDSKHLKEWLGRSLAFAATLSPKAPKPKKK